MENGLNPYGKECMRMAILKHEQTFREQVYELHRLYRIQKILMKNTTNNSRHIGQEQNKWVFQNSTKLNQLNDHLDTSRRILQGLDLERPAEEYNEKTDGDEMVDKSDLELTLGPSSLYRRRSRKDADASSPLLSDSGPSLSSSSSACSQKWRPDNNPISGASFLGERKQNSDVEEQLRQEDRINNPPWIFQLAMGILLCKHMGLDCHSSIKSRCLSNVLRETREPQKYLRESWESSLVPHVSTSNSKFALARLD